jgi:hypothetical protein
MTSLGSPDLGRRRSFPVINQENRAVDRRRPMRVRQFEASAIVVSAMLAICLSRTMDAISGAGNALELLADFSMALFRFPG